MPDYKGMYYILFNKITDTVNQLTQVQQEVEEMYINCQSNNIQIINDNKISNKKSN
jgi:hypothetical protein